MLVPVQFATFSRSGELIRVLNRDVTLNQIPEIIRDLQGEDPRCVRVGVDVALPYSPSPSPIKMTEEEQKRADEEWEQIMSAPCLGRLIEHIPDGDGE